jgi:hypothetical protein
MAGGWQKKPTQNAVKMRAALGGLFASMQCSCTRLGRLSTTGARGRKYRQGCMRVAEAATEGRAGAA